MGLRRRLGSIKKVLYEVIDIMMNTKAHIMKCIRHGSLAELSENCKGARRD
jgi:hypothetical protein